MDAYLVPIGRGRYELYCEPGEEPALADAPPSGLWRRWADRFTAVIAAAEREQDARAGAHAAADGSPPTWGRRVRKRALAWVAEKIAEQRLLWRLRGKAQVRAFYPAGLDAAAALSTIRGTLLHEFDRHRWWLVVDLLGGLLSLALVPLPGPNVIGLYFTFRIVGHFLALRGARHGLKAVRWELEPSATLAALADVAGLPAHERERRVQQAADELGLPRFPHFYRRTGSGAA